jgi:hypothetical protein
MNRTCQTSIEPAAGRLRTFSNARVKFGLIFTAAVLSLALLLYSPALGGPFIFDDLSLPLTLAQGQHSLAGWVSTSRPILIFSYQLNAILLGDEPLSYHLVNLLIHVVNTCLVFLVLRRLLLIAGWTGRKIRIAACIGSAVFLIHPLQTESVSYIAGRSESLASFFLLAAYAVFLYRTADSISWRRAVVVLLLFGLAVKTKENAVSLAGILLLTDVMWPVPFSLQGVRKNWRLYALMLPGAVIAAVVIFRMLATASTAGFAVTTFKWYQYGFTEARALFTYLQLAVFPMGQSLDHDFPPSHTITQHGALVYMAVLAVVLAAAIYWRRRFPLACFGLLMFLAWLAPTSSIVPVTDPLVERRMYLAILGLILIGCDVVDRLKPSLPVAASLATVMALTFGGFCYSRNQLWGKPELLLALAAKDARSNPRPLINMSELLIKHNRCDLAVPYLERAERMLPGNYFVNASWGRALACLGHPEEGLQRLQFAARLQPTSQVYLWIGLVYGQMGRSADAGAALQEAVRREPTSAAAHGALALWYESIGNYAAAEREYRSNVALDPLDQTARISLARVSSYVASPAP